MNFIGASVKQFQLNWMSLPEQLGVFTLSFYEKAKAIRRGLPCSVYREHSNYSNRLLANSVFRVSLLTLDLVRLAECRSKSSQFDGLLLLLIRFRLLSQRFPGTQRTSSRRITSNFLADWVWQSDSYCLPDCVWWNSFKQLGMTERISPKLIRNW